MKIGYARVSTVDQNLDLQKDALLKAGCEKIYEETESGAKTERPELIKLMENLRSGDTLVVWRLDRLGRNLKHLIQTVETLDSKQVGFQSVTEAIDTTTPGGRLVFNIFASLSQFEREIIRERTKAGLIAARARGRKGGRKPVLDEAKRKHAQTLRNDTSQSITAICKTLGISRATFYRGTEAPSQKK
jgi:DNA invertase Pin-like site-specific DNA recombinase